MRFVPILHNAIQITSWETARCIVEDDAKLLTEATLAECKQFISEVKRVIKGRHYTPLQRLIALYLHNQ
jgi:hypothetical protein